MKITLPWADGPSRSSGATVSATETEFARFRDLPGVTVAALRLRRMIRRSPGAIGVTLSMRPLARRSWSVSAWETEDDLRRFVRSPAHLATVRRYRDRVTVTAQTWREENFDPSDVRVRAKRGS